MPKVLLVNELGSGLGHLNRLVAVARGLSDDCELIFAFSDRAAAQSAVQQVFGTRAQAVQGPVWMASRSATVRDSATHTFADVLALFNFMDQDVVRGNADLWRSLVATTRADLVIADFAPSARIGSDESTPLIVVGNGFTVPPPGRSFPPMRAWEHDVPESSSAAENAILRSLNGVRGSFGFSPFAYVADAFSASSTFVCSIAAFDPYHPHRMSPLHQPFNVPLVELGPAQGGRDGPAIFVYMPAEHPLFASLLQALNTIQLPIHLYATGQAPEVTAAKCQRHIGVLRRAADLSQILPKVRLVIHHGGLGTAYAAMMAGTPQFLLPRNLEHLITARGLIDVGIGQGYSVNTNPSVEDLRNGIVTMLSEPRWLERALAEGQRLHATLNPNPLRPILDVCDALLR